MNFYRHRLEDSTGTDFRNIMPANLDSWGFCLVDGSPITSVDDIYGTNTSHCFKWKYDSTSVVNDLYHTFKCISPGMPGFVLFTGSAAGSMTGLNTNTFFFIPLKNKGFVLRSELSDTLSLTPSFHPYKYYAQSKWAYPDEHPMNTIVGLFEGNILNPMIYLQMGSVLPKALLDPETLIPYRWFDSRQGYGYSSQRFDFIIGSQLIAFPSFIEDPHWYGIGDTDHNPNYPATEWSFTENKYTNTIQNVCTLIRAPYENQYLDNLYIVTTKPCDSIDGKVFSFNGRNFLGIYDNLAVELPAN